MPGARLEDLVLSENRTLLQYVSEAFPWTKAAAANVRDAVLHFARSEAVAVGRLARYLAKVHRPIPSAGSFPIGFTTINFVSLGYLLPRLAQEQQDRVAEVARVYSTVPEGEAKVLVGALLKLKERHLEQLREFAASVEAPTPIAS